MKKTITHQEISISSIMDDHGRWHDLVDVQLNPHPGHVEFPLLYMTLKIVILSFIFKSFQHGRYDHGRLDACNDLLAQRIKEKNLTGERLNCLMIIVLYKLDIVLNGQSALSARTIEEDWSQIVEDLHKQKVSLV
jgi:hypothetical protein